MIQPLFISVDPMRDTPEKVKTYLKGTLLLKHGTGHTCICICTHTHTLIPTLTPLPPLSLGPRAEFHPRLVGLTGSVDQVQAACKSYRVYFSTPNEEDGEDYLVDHSIIMYFMNPEGKYTAYYGQNTTAEQAAASIKKHILEAKAKAKQAK